MQVYKPTHGLGFWEEANMLWNFAYSLGPVSGTISGALLLWALLRVILLVSHNPSSVTLVSKESDKQELANGDSSEALSGPRESVDEDLQVGSDETTAPDASTSEPVKDANFISPDSKLGVPLNPSDDITINVESDEEFADFLKSLEFKVDPITKMLMGDSPTADSIRETAEDVHSMCSETALGKLAKDSEANLSQVLLETALKLAAKNGRYEVVKLLADAGVNEKWGSAFEATKWGHSKIVELLLGKQAVDFLEERPLLCEAASRGYANIVCFFLRRGLDIDANGSSWYNPMKAAAKAGREEIVKLLLNKGADVNGGVGVANEWKTTPLVEAATWGHGSVVEILLDSGAKLNDGNFGSSALLAALKNNRVYVCEFLLDRGAIFSADNLKDAPSNRQLMDALRLSVLGRSTKLAMHILEYGADVNAPEGIYGSILQYASTLDDGNMVRFLVRKGAHIDSGGGLGGSSPLMAAAAAGNSDIVAFLIAQGARMNSAHGFFGNALQTAAYLGHEEVVKALLEESFDVNARKGKFGNALWLALQGDHKRVIRLLVVNGANLGIERT
jgi:ankyrin repeat protein